MNGVDLTICLNAAYDEIKDRTGKMVEGGAFVKDVYNDRTFKVGRSWSC